jgi:hypothetical protein
MRMMTEFRKDAFALICDHLAIDAADRVSEDLGEARTD